MNSERIESFIVKKTTKLAEAMQKIDDNANGIVFVVDEVGLLCGAVSDGDIRRWILKAGSIEAEICLLMNDSPKSISCEDVAKASDIMLEKNIRALPVVDAEGRITDLCLAKEMERNDAHKEDLVGVPVVIMAGGKGTRLYPYTKILPKPLIPIGEIPIVERVMDYFNNYGIDEFFMTVNYKKNMIQSYFAETGKDYAIRYVEEDMPLGTGGSIKLIDRKFDRPVFVANCDSLIRTDYSLLYRHHIEAENDITLVTSVKNEKIPYGVVHANANGELDHLVEKPTMSYLINTGMYVINPDMIELIPAGEMFHMTQLVEKAKDLGYKVGMFPVSEDSFLDMGEFAEMKRMEDKLNIQ